MLKSNLCVYCDADILLKGNRTINQAGADVAQRADEINKQVTFKSCVPFAHCITQINYNKIDNLGSLW